MQGCCGAIYQGLHVKAALNLEVQKGPNLQPSSRPAQKDLCPQMQLTSVGDGGDRASTKVSPQIIVKGLSNATNNQWSKRNAVRRLPQLWKRARNMFFNSLY